MDKLKSYSFTFLSLILVTIPVSMMGLWIYAFELSNVQSERVEIFNSYLPEFMESTMVSTLVSISFCIAAILLTIPNFKSSNALIKGINIIVRVVGICILGLNVFSLL